MMVAILLHDRLHAAALRHMVETLGVQCAVVSDLAAAEDADFLLTDTAHFVAHLKWFLPRQSRVVVVSEQTPATDSPAHLNPQDDESLLLEQLDQLLRRGNSEATDNTATLSQREIDVLRLVASGYINKEIADKLNISINTVLSHRKNITAKLGIKSVSGLSLYAMMNGII